MTQKVLYDLKVSKNKEVFLSEALHCCYSIYKYVLSFFAYMYKSMTVEPEKYKEKNFELQKLLKKWGKVLGLNPWTSPYNK